MHTSHIHRPLYHGTDGNARRPKDKGALHKGTSNSKPWHFDLDPARLPTVEMDYSYIAVANTCIITLRRPHARAHTVRVYTQKKRHVNGLRYVADMGEPPKAQNMLSMLRLEQGLELPYRGTDPCPRAQTTSRLAHPIPRHYFGEPQHPQCIWAQGTIKRSHISLCVHLYGTF